MQAAIDVLIEAIELCRTGNSRANAREIQADMRTIAGFLSQLPGYFPQLREPQYKGYRHVDSYVHSGLPFVSWAFRFVNDILRCNRGVFPQATCASYFL